MLAAITTTYHVVVVDLSWWADLAVALAALAVFAFVIIRIRRHLSQGKPPPLPPADRTA